MSGVTVVLVQEEPLKRPLSAAEVRRNAAHAHFLAMQHDPTLMPPIIIEARVRLDVPHATFNERGEVNAVQRRRRHKK